MLELKEDTLDTQDAKDETQTNISEQERRLKASNVGSVSCLLPTHSDEDDTMVRDLPGMNLPEKILFVIDTIREKNCTPFKLTTGAKYMPLFMIKRVVENFVCIKSSIQSSHEYALMILNTQGVHWICDFTNNIKTIVNLLDTINEDVLEENQQIYCLGQMFATIQSRLLMPPKKQGTTIPTFVNRVILMYSRSYCVPIVYTGKTFLERLTDNPYFFIDVLYVHEPPSSENSCEKIYAELATLETTNFSYILEVGRNAAKLHDNMAKLLAHPLQRPPQKDTCYTIIPPSSSQEMYTNV
ncbi:BRISC and BRCA1-A complex member 1 [Colletes latitarsis]|uniref:BRISC and BRCA1-A complex member 1 n=1 Tax=Colletes latitarsis TaxID=2605962 RepID=UPI00403616AE